ncbi:MAG: tetratricopeptide repeat protein [archaeon]
MKDYEKTQRLLNWSEGKTSPPFRIQLNVTDRCNLNCVFCRGLSRDRPELSDARLRGIVDEAHRLGVREWLLSGGGEPFMRPVTIMLMKQIRDHGMNGTVITNGTLLTDDMIKNLVLMGWESICFSIEGACEKTNDCLRGRGSFGRATAAMQKLAEFKRAAAVKLPSAVLTMVLCNRNYKELPGMVDLAKQMGCDFLNVNPIKGSGHLDKLRLSKEQSDKLKNSLFKAIGKVEEYGIESDLDKLDVDLIRRSNEMKSVVSSHAHQKIEYEKRGFLSVPCYEPWYNLMIHPDGRVGACCERTIPGLNAKTDLNHIWNSREFAMFRSDLLEGRLPAECSRCGAWQYIRTQMLRRDMHFSLYDKYRKKKATKKEVMERFGEIGTFFYENSMFGRAIDYMKHLLKVNPDNRNAWLVLGRIYMQTRKHAMALGCYEKLEGLEDSSERRDLARYSIARCKRELGRFEEAIGLLENIPPGALALRDLGECHMELGQYEKARDCLLRSVEMDPELEWSWFSLGKCHAKSGNYKEAARCLKKSLKVKQPEAAIFHTLYFLAICSYRLDNLKEAASYFRRAQGYDFAEIPEERSARRKLEKLG